MNLQRNGATLSLRGFWLFCPFLKCSHSSDLQDDALGSNSRVFDAENVQRRIFTVFYGSIF